MHKRTGNRPFTVSFYQKCYGKSCRKAAKGTEDNLQHLSHSPVGYFGWRRQWRLSGNKTCPLTDFSLTQGGIFRLYKKDYSLEIVTACFSYLNNLSVYTFYHNHFYLSDLLKLVLCTLTHIIPKMLTGKITIFKLISKIF